MLVTRSAISVRTHPASLTAGRVSCVWGRRMSGPLSGIRVLDLSRVLAGPWATQLLGDYGADVIKVERPVQGDDTRHWGPPWLEQGDGGPGRESAYFLAANRNKRSLAVDLSCAAGQRLVRELAAKADVLVENFKAGTLDQWGLEAGALRRDNPGLIVCTISAFSRSSRRAHEPGYDAMIQASGGLMSITGAPDKDGGGPQKVGVAIADIMCGMYAATAIIAALYQRSSSGRGQSIEVPLYDSQVAWLANQAMNYLVGGEVPGRLGTAHPNIVPYQSFRTRDGFIMIAVGNDRQFAECMRCLGMSEVAADIRFQRNEDRLANRDSLVALMSTALEREPTRHWLGRLTEAGVPCSPINDIGEVFSSAYAAECSLVRNLRHPYQEELPTVANPVRFSSGEISYESAPPLLCEHSEEVLADWLGYSATTISRLKEAGTI
jgi:crotonobetainyl-CoA:carnitine CoA-transferase CaiB-like acyl-CoA transferase